MERKRFTEQQIHDILKESEAGANSLELCRKYGISKNTVWRKTRNAWSLSLNLFSKCSNYLRRDTSHNHSFVIRKSLVTSSFESVLEQTIKEHVMTNIPNMFFIIPLLIELSPVYKIYNL